MTIRIALHHRTEYHFDRRVKLSPHSIRLRPAPHTRTPVHEYSLKVEPEEHFINWVQDPFGNFIGRFVFPEKTDKLVIDVNLVADLVTVNPFDFFVEEYAEYYPFKYEHQLKKELTPYFEKKEEGKRLKSLLKELKKAQLGVSATLANEENFKDKKDKKAEPRAHIVHFLVALNAHIKDLIGYNIRMEPGIQSCEQTLQKKTGSCRDTGWLLVQVLRHLGLAARFVSGYLVQLTSDQKSLDGPSGPEEDFTDLHAWAEVFIPGAGWVGLDPTSGLFAGEGHIPLACTPDPVSAAPITGATDECEVSFKFINEVFRIHEDPRVTKPYTEKQWEDIQKLGRLTDQKLQQGDVRLTMGGEPTFVSIDDMESAQWNIEALGEHKLDRAYTLLLRLRDVFSNKGVLHYGQGKWYPGEQLPRWALTCAWLKDNSACWNHEHLLDAPNSKSTYKNKQAKKLIKRISKHLGLDKKHINKSYEDAPYYLWKEGTLPDNVDVLDNKIKEDMERKRIRRVFDKGLNKVAGYCIPLEWSESKNHWKSCGWKMRRKHLYLIPGDSAMGYRLPLDSLLWEPENKRQKLIEKDPFDEFDQLPAMRDRLHIVRNQNYEPLPETADLKIQPDSLIKSSDDEDNHFIRTALCVEQRDGHLYIFLPPLMKLEYYLDLLNAIEASARELDVKVIMEGYEPPHDPRLQRMQVTPDPGVIEVNIHPSENWDELENNTTILYEEARLSRLGTEKFMIDGRHSGTGGGNHITIGAAKPVDSPILRRPHLLKSLLTYWQNHPSLSYLFSGLFMGPTSQSPRVDEARDDALYELGIALSEMTHDESHSPWLVDRLLRNILVDLTGNTHRAEFCIDKLYSPNGTAGRLGLVEFRGFEMPPHAQMSLVQALLLRSLISLFWDKPYEQQLVNWGTELHDRFMLPHFVEKDMQDVIAHLQREGYDFDQSWMDPFVEFRFPRYGVINIDDIELELRFAIEPWHVLGEEVSAQGTSRYVDSSVERLQVKVNGMTDSRHYITCNGRRVPLRNTGTRGEYIGGVRYKAWHPPSALHPTIVAQAPLVFDIVDGWNKKSLGGCTYHVSHPGGRSESSFPVNAYEAESRRLARFQIIGHSGGIMEVPIEKVNPDFPLTLDLRRRTIKGERV